MNKVSPINRSSLILDAIIIVILVGPQAYWIWNNINPNNREEGLYLFLAGIITGMSYYFPKGCHILQFIYKAYMTIGLPRYEWAILMYSISFIVAGGLRFIDFSL